MAPYHRFVPQMGPLLSLLCQLGDAESKKHKQIVPSAAPVQVGGFLHRLHNSRCSEAVFITQMILISRLHVCPGFVTCSININQILLSTFVIAVKICDDSYYSNDVYARMAGVPLATLNKLETSVLQLLNWDVYVSRDEYDAMEETLEEQLKALVPSVSPLEPRRRSAGSGLKLVRTLSAEKSAPASPPADFHPSPPSRKSRGILSRAVGHV